MVATALGLMLFPAMMAFAASSDLRTMTISNRVSLILIGGFFLFALVIGMSGNTMLWHIGAGGTVLAVAFGCFAMGWISGGDAKLAAATALWFGFDHLLPYLFLNFTTPGWMIEGLATYEETEGTAFGRGRNPDTRMILRMAALEGDFLREDEAGLALDRWPAGQTPYLFGEAFLDDLGDRFGPSILRELARVHSGRIIPYLDEMTARKVTGTSETSPPARAASVARASSIARASWPRWTSSVRRPPPDGCVPVPPR